MAGSLNGPVIPYCYKLGVQSAHNFQFLESSLLTYFFICWYCIKQLLLDGWVPKWASRTLLLKVRGPMGPSFPISRIITGSHFFEPTKFPSFSLTFQVFFPIFPAFFKHISRYRFLFSFHVTLTYNVFIFIFSQNNQGQLIVHRNDT